MRKARPSREKPKRTLDESPRQSPPSPPRRRKSGRRRSVTPRPSANGVRDRDDGAGATPPGPDRRSHAAVRDDDLNAVRRRALRRPPSSPSRRPSRLRARTLGGRRPGRQPMQVLRLNDLKRMKITELSKMAHDFGIEGRQGLKKQDLIFAILSRHRRQAASRCTPRACWSCSPTASGSCAAPDSRLPAQPRRHLRLALAGAPLQPAHRRHRHGPDSPARARASASSRCRRSTRSTSSTRAEAPRADPLRQPHPALPDEEAASSSTTARR